MATKSQKTKVGIFLVLCGLLMGGSLYLVSGYYQDEGIHYYLEFDESILGLYEGGMVEYLGVPVGKVRSISVDTATNKPYVQIVINPEKATLHHGVQAKLVLYSFAAGTMAISLTGGDITLGRLPEGSIIPTQPSAITAIASEAQGLMERVEGILGKVETGLEGMESGDLTAVVNKVNGLLDDAGVFLDDTRELVNTANATVGGLRDDARGVIASAEEIMEELKPTIRNLNELMATSNEKVKQLDINAAQTQLNTILENVAEITTKLNETVREVDGITANALHEADNVENDLRMALKQMSEALYSMRMFVEQLQSNPGQLIRGKIVVEDK